MNCWSCLAARWTGRQRRHVSRQDLRATEGICLRGDETDEDAAKAVGILNGKEVAVARFGWTGRGSGSASLLSH